MIPELGHFALILALILAWTLFDERIAGWSLVGIAVVLAAVTANTLSGSRGRKTAISGR